MLLTHANIITMEDENGKSQIIPDGYILISNSKIASLGAMEQLPNTQDEQVIDLAGKTVYPGFIDAHCHMGLAEEGLGFEGDDLNEITDPTTPHLRGLDAINPNNKSFQEAYSAGITTVVTGPGSANPIGGQFCAIKTYGKNVDKMLLRAPVSMKFAMGENPKGCYNDKSQTPMTRMATAAIIREQLQKAHRYMEDQLKADNDPEGETDPPEFDAKCEALIPVLRRELKAQFHCHRTDDIFTAIRIAKEFNLDYVLIHCTEGYMIADELEEIGATAICGPLMTTRSKPELTNSTDANPALLSKHIPVAICTDYNVLPIAYLPVCAGIAVREGMDRELALKAITIQAAKTCGIENRVGSIQAGKDADLAIFDCDPLTIAARPAMVLINGKIVFQRS